MPEGYCDCANVAIATFFNLGSFIDRGIATVLVSRDYIAKSRLSDGISCSISEGYEECVSDAVPHFVINIYGFSSVLVGSDNAATSRLSDGATE